MNGASAGNTWQPKHAKLQTYPLLSQTTLMPFNLMAPTTMQTLC